MVKPRVLIIGAGMAGVAAGNALTTSGFSVTLLEARSRIGGRIWIDHSLGVPLSRGATWIHGTDGNPMAALAQKFSAEYYAVDFEKFVFYDRHNKLITQKNYWDFRHAMDASLAQAKSFAARAPHDIPLATALKPFIEPSQWSEQEYDLFKRQLNFFENYIGAGYQFISGRHWDDEESFPGDQAILSDGYAAITDGLAKTCSIKLNTIVETVCERSNDIEVTTNQGTFQADAVLVTLPLGVLKKRSVTFQPALSALKQQAIDRLGMGLFNIIALQFNEIFWNNEAHAFVLTGSPTGVMFLNLGQFIQQPILLGCTGGETGRNLENESDASLVEKTVLYLKNVFGNTSAQLKNAFVTRWAQDPFSFGSYSYLPVGATGADYDHLAEPESQRLFFAGEATNRHYPATTHGAYLSGLREAERIKRLFG